MNPDLDTLIAHFRAEQDAAVQLLTHTLGVPRPATNIDWTVFRIDNAIRQNAAQQGIRLRKHGYGVAITVKGLRIDFDWGKDGEQDGFNAGWLYVFATHNRKKVKCSFVDTKVWIEEAFAASELMKVGELYFDPKRRATT